MLEYLSVLFLPLMNFAIKEFTMNSGVSGSAQGQNVAKEAKLKIIHIYKTGIYVQ